jgi:hypothetical protein
MPRAQRGAACQVKLRPSPLPPPLVPGTNPGFSLPDPELQCPHSSLSSDT